MREYKFRGRLLSGHGWTYGDLHRLPTGETCIWFTTDGVPGKRQGVSGQDPVDPKTVGQYTGLNDINRRPIFEGDILRNDTFGIIGAVSWSAGLYRFIVEKGDEIVGDLCDYDWQPEVVGNIYDNPEVLAND